MLQGSESRGSQVFMCHSCWKDGFICLRILGIKNIPLLRGREGQDVAVRRVLLSEAIGMLGGSDGSLDQYVVGGGEIPLATGVTRVCPQRAVVYCCSTR